MTIVALVRHGQTDWNATGKFQGSSDIPLNELGREQAQIAVPFLREFAEKTNKDWDTLRFSPLQRARETGYIIADALGIEDRRVLPSMVERDWGWAEGHTLEEINAANPVLAGLPQRQAREGILGAEPRLQVINRGVYALRSMATIAPDSNIVVATHGSVLRYTVEHLIAESLGEVPNLGAVVLKVEIRDGVMCTERITQNF